MSNKRVGATAAAVLAVAVVAYGGATWYMGQRAQSSYQEAVAELRKALGNDVVVSDDYVRGFFSAQARLVLQWAAPAAEQGAAAAQPLRVVVNSTVRHGPLAGARLAAAVVDSRFAVEGLDAKTEAQLSKASSPTLHGVHHLTGGQDIRFVLPAGELGDATTTVRWQEMAYDMAISRGGDHLKGRFRLPEFGIVGLPDTTAQAQADEADADAEEDDTDETANDPMERMSIALVDMEGEFDNAVIDGLWGIGPGTAGFRVARVQASMTPPGGGAVKPLLDVKDVVGSYVIDAANGTLGMTTNMKTAGRIGPIDFESIGLEEKIQRISIEAIRSFQRVLLDSYRAGGIANMAEAMEQQSMALLMENAPRLVQALPAYSMKMQATYLGKTGELSYGAEVKQAPSDAEVAQAGWTPALMKHSVLTAGARVPKAWLAPIMQSTGKREVKPEEIDAMVGMAQSSGYVKQDGEHVTGDLQLVSGELVLNGKRMPLPPGLLR